MVVFMITMHIIQAAHGWSAGASSIFGTNMAESSGTDWKLKLITLL